MGEMADYFLEQVDEFEEAYLDFKLGKLPYDIAYDRGIIDEMGFEERTKGITKTCRCCGKDGLTWGNLNNKWLLFEGNVLHDCPKNKYNKKERKTDV